MKVPSHQHHHRDHHPIVGTTNHSAPVAMVALLNVHPWRGPIFSNRTKCSWNPPCRSTVLSTASETVAAGSLRSRAPLRLSNSTLIYDSGLPDEVNPEAREIPVQELPHDVVRYLYNSRYCEVDRFSIIALELFGAVTPGWSRVQAICDWIHSRVSFGYQYARPTKTALDVYTERFGVCRDFQHLAVTMCRALNIPARYITGIWATSVSPSRESWTSAPGLRFIWKIAGGLLTPATTSRGLDAS